MAVAWQKEERGRKVTQGSVWTERDMELKGIAYACRVHVHV